MTEMTEQEIRAKISALETVKNQNLSNTAAVTQIVHQILELQRKLEALGGLQSVTGSLNLEK